MTVPLHILESLLSINKSKCVNVIFSRSVNLSCVANGTRTISTVGRVNESMVFYAINPEEAVVVWVCV